MLGVREASLMGLLLFSNFINVFYLSTPQLLFGADFSNAIHNLLLSPSVAGNAQNG